MCDISTLKKYIYINKVFLGYANEVGEAFRSLVPKSIVWSSYALSSGYVLADTIHKGVKVYQVLREFLI